MGQNEICFQNDPEFLEFLNLEFNRIAIHASVEELSEFAFGSMKEAIQAFEKYQTNRNNE